MKNTYTLLQIALEAELSKTKVENWLVSSMNALRVALLIYA